jgi:thymidylate synthase (FAD)
MCSFVQESTRYCNYSKDKFDGEITVIRPSTWDEMVLTQQERWQEAVRESETAYLGMLKAGSSPQQARAVLPNSLKTEIVVRANFREWMHIFKLRCAKTAHPDMQVCMIPLRNKCIEMLPCVFSDLKDDLND